MGLEDSADQLAEIDDLRKEDQKLRSISRRRVFRAASPAIIVLACIILANTIFKPYVVNGNSMNPTLLNAQLVLIWNTTTPSRGDIIGFNRNQEWDVLAQDLRNIATAEHYGFEPPKGATSVRDDGLALKRIAAIPGDTIVYGKTGMSVRTPKGEKIEIQLSEKCKKPQKDVTYTLKDGEFFVTGDNFRHSLDSRALTCHSWRKSEQNRSWSIPSAAIVKSKDVDAHGSLFLKFPK